MAPVEGDSFSREIICMPCEGEGQAECSEKELEAEGEEEAEKVGKLPAPYQPTRSEYDDHCVTHYPSRS